MAATSESVLPFLGRSALVFGATSGIGEAMALRLAELGFSVTAVGRSRERGEAVLAKLDGMESKAPGQSHEFMACDGSLVRNMENFVSTYTGEGTEAPRPTLDVLVITQGIATLDSRTETIEGIDVKMATHYYARIALINALLPTLQSSSNTSDDWTGPKVMSVLAAGVHPPYKHYRDDPGLLHHYSPKAAADAATLYNDLAMDSLARANPGITFFHSYPGFVNTNWGTQMPWYVRWPVRLIQPLGRSPYDCATTLCHAMLYNSPDPSQPHPNFRLIDDKGRPTHTTSVHEEAREFIWRHTLETIENARTHQAPSH